MTLSKKDQLFNDLAFGYQPNIPLCEASIAVLIFLCILTVVQNVRTKSWYMFIVSATCLTEMGGYIARYYMANVDPNRETYIAMTVLLILSPNALALVNYVTVGLVVECASKKGISEKGRLAWINHRTLSGIFMTSDFIAFIVQGAAAGLITSSSDQNKIDLGRKVMMAGLAVQMGFFSLFSFITIYVHSSQSFHLRHNKGVRPVFVALYITIILLTTRSIYRFIQFSNTKGYVAVHESFFYCFDTLVVVFCMLTYIILPFGRYMDFEGEAVNEEKMQPMEIRAVDA